MDDRRFDALTRGLAFAGNRRRVLKGLLGLGGTLAVTSLERAEAARRPTPTPRPVHCPGQQTWNGSACECPEGFENCGPDCCASGISECCDNACCFGSCYGEELCCQEGTIFCGGECRPGECGSDSDCPEGSICDPSTYSCVCTPNCDGKTCGDNGCGGQCGSCPDGQSCQNGVCGCSVGFLCTDGACHACCEGANCATFYGGDTECWACVSGTCAYYGGFCSSGTCGTSSADVIGHCVECGKSGPLSPDACNAEVPCCAGYTCDFKFGDTGLCRTL